ncbi:hypothetical protein CAOG_03639 [Capsaspora owczarzaki ATCC 30864]|uniref:Trafficking protein particle complex subunit 13 n=1 Tax=Capsaspora owczarzaki (strain ATCC 30864) TaxID=595528 RepID=A0A0D2WNK3_CAPO3|nr:hypothetical protein CAOG_03639 [Capsaspora owczarzaki ATCC 30864]KJE92725.1 hypothetical protein CAOG_003639 [Capsaspora owczarzaki ATCC 30864]|eukprot:XP_004363367.1 hypothetical protein CAOG_03639 [Capsaspora owczarzaki ATCC 30864]
MADGSKEVHYLVLKVMRLSKPTLVIGQPIVSEPSDFAGSVLQEVQTADVSTAGQPELFSLSSFLMLPQNFGNIFLGETFSSYISVHNDSNMRIRDVAVKAELQTTSQRVPLSDLAPSDKELSPGASVDVVVHHEVKELGVHILVCSVSYMTADDERKIFRKFFKFNVLHPLAVKTKVYNVEDDIFLEAQVQNITPAPMYIEAVKFEAMPQFDFQDLNVLSSAASASSSSTNQAGLKASPATTFGLAYHVNPQDIRQYLYRLSPKVKGDKTARAADKIGKMDILWKTNMGEVGRLQTSQLPRKLPALTELAVTVVEVPDNVVLEVPFTVQCRITNYSEHKMSLRLFAVKSRMTGVLAAGVSGQSLGELFPEASKIIPLEFFPAVPGLQRVSGLRLMDVITGKSFEIDSFMDVLVHSREYVPPPAREPASLSLSIEVSARQ